MSDNLPDTSACDRGDHKRGAADLCTECGAMLMPDMAHIERYRLMDVGMGAARMFSVKNPAWHSTYDGEWVRWDQVRTAFEKSNAPDKYRRAVWFLQDIASLAGTTKRRQAGCEMAAHALAQLGEPRASSTESARETGGDAAADLRRYVIQQLGFLSDDDNCPAERFIRLAAERLRAAETEANRPAC